MDKELFGYLTFTYHIKLLNRTKIKLTGSEFSTLHVTRIRAKTNYGNIENRYKIDGFMFNITMYSNVLLKGQLFLSQGKIKMLKKTQVYKVICAIVMVQCSR